MIQKEYAYDKQNQTARAFHQYVLGRMQETKKERRAKGDETYENSMGHVERYGGDLCALYIIRVGKIEGGKSENILRLCQPEAGRG
jgi:hypothetical protein